MANPLRVLFDNGVFAHSAFAEPCSMMTEVKWSNGSMKAPVLGFQRKRPSDNKEHQKQIDALYTIGRLVREGQIRPYEYCEIMFEGIRGRMQPPAPCDAFEGCKAENCPSALERSKFMQTELGEFIRKGGKKDDKAGRNPNGFSQIAFCKFLCNLSPEHIAKILERRRSILPLTDFELDSLREIDWFKTLRQKCGSPESFPDIFHLWTAQRNGFDVFLTLDKAFANFIGNVRKEKRSTLEIKPDVLLPLGLLEKLGVKELDPIPMEFGRFYPLVGTSWTVPQSQEDG